MTTSGWGYTCLTRTTCHLSHITSLINPHPRRLKLRHSVTDTILYLNIFRADEWPTCLRTYLPTGSTPRDPSKAADKSEWHIKLLPAASVSQLPDRGPVPSPGINYTGPREVLLEFVILVSQAIFMNKCFIVEIFWGEKYSWMCRKTQNPDVGLRKLQFATIFH